MRFKGLIWVIVFASIFFILPSLALKFWNGFIYWNWEVKKVILYVLVGIIFVYGIRRRLFRRKTASNNEIATLLLIAKRRLAEGEINIEEFRQIKQEIE